MEAHIVPLGAARQEEACKTTDLDPDGWNPGALVENAERSGQSHVMEGRSMLQMLQPSPDRSAEQHEGPRIAVGMGRMRAL